MQVTGAVHGAPQSSSQHILELSLRALALCKKIRSFSWSDDNRLPDSIFISFLDVLVTLPALEELTIRTFGNLSDEVWKKLHRFTKLRGVAIFCMEGPPRVLQGWSELLGPSLSSLELGVSNGSFAQCVKKSTSQLLSNSVVTVYLQQSSSTYFHTCAISHTYESRAFHLMRYPTCSPTSLFFSRLTPTTQRASRPGDHHHLRSASRACKTS